MATSKHPLLLAAAVAHGVLSLGHTTKGLEQFKHASMSALPTALRGAVKAGWYEGSGFFLMMAILNYKWAQTGLLDVYDKSIAGLLVAILVGAAGSYFQSGDKPTATTLAVLAVLQGLGAKGVAL
ncbi:hypothetical protein BU25DRAFT_488230 [Macroventuria anomochaeta]|uniref:Uncharacterized protein n=1 Tax=Macroventuria anomochaeta TaxID=301207 RepID=A0ACB6SEH4_9PLEO|nr:uncharacterized protein BU25DRAFT_488230 [Macroventuria anomochaeta]KAF2631659.1 hypothetical protein BU25DRAFT_488230 [Macroventuria anomochaeta]